VIALSAVNYLPIFSLTILVTFGMTVFAITTVPTIGIAQLPTFAPVLSIFLLLLFFVSFLALLLIIIHPYILDIGRRIEEESEVSVDMIPEIVYLTFVSA